jgi:hypothetical protein
MFVGAPAGRSKIELRQTHKNRISRFERTD